MKQSAVEWLVDEMKADDWWYLSASMKDDIIKQAKEMENKNQNNMESVRAKDILNVIESYYQELESLRLECVESFGLDDEDTKRVTMQCTTIDILRDRINELQ